MRFLLCIINILFIFYADIVCANEYKLTLQNMNLPDAIRLLANDLRINVIISPNIKGRVSLNFNTSTPRLAFNFLLASQGLASWQKGEFLYVAKRDELIQGKQAEQRWQEAASATAPLVTEFWRVRYSRAEDIASVIQKISGSLLSKRGHISVDKRTNSLLIEEEAAQLSKLRQLVARMDVPVQQVMIMARLASVDATVKRDLGIDFSVISQKGAQATQGSYGLAIVKLADASLLDVKLNALENAGHAELISRPSLFAPNQQTAYIEAGEEVPYQEVSESGGTAVVFKKAVLSLKVTPQILPDKNVLLDLQINQDRPSGNFVLGMPTISTRQIVTSALLKNGQTIVLGGIYETDYAVGKKRIPFISQLPIVGWLFKQEALQRNKRELLIFVTPNIVT